MVLCVTGLSGAVLLFIMSLPSLEGLEGLEHPRWLTHGWSWCNPNWEGQPELLGAPSCGLVLWLELLSAWCSCSKRRGHSKKDCPRGKDAEATGLLK